MSEPHVPSDDAAILRAHDRKFINAQMSFDAACRVCRERPHRWNIEKVKQAILGLADEYLAGQEALAGRQPGSFARLTQETIDAPPSTASRVERWEDGPETGAGMSDKVVPVRRCSCFDTHPPSETCPTCEDQFLEVTPRRNPAPIMSERGERKPLPKYDCQDDPHEQVLVRHRELAAEYRNGCSNAPDSPILSKAQSDFGRRLPPRHMPPVDPTIEAGDPA
jgi:hypothetical protein